MSDDIHETGRQMSSHADNPSDEFKALLSDYGDRMYASGASQSDIAWIDERKQAVLDYVARLEANPMHIILGSRPPMTLEQLGEYVAALEARQITPEIIALVEKIDAARGISVGDEGYMLSSEKDRLQERICDLLRQMLRGEG